MTQPPPIRVLILGAASGIAQSTARLYASEGAILGLAGRDAGRLRTIGDDLIARGAAQVELFDVDFATSPAESEFAGMIDRLGGVDHVVLAFGLLGEQSRAEKDSAHTLDIIDVNFRAAALWSLAAANTLERQRRGSLVVLGSVAGDRGRRSNFVYGASKAGLAALVEGIAHRFADKGPRAVIVKPGPTTTAMTAGMKQGGPLWASPDTVAAIVRRAADRGGPVVYAPARWRIIMTIIRALPAAIFNKMNL